MARALFGVAFLCMGLDSLLKGYGLMPSDALPIVAAIVVLAGAIRLRSERRA
jgi:hypothetical protein